MICGVFSCSGRRRLDNLQCWQRLRRLVSELSPLFESYEMLGPPSVGLHLNRIGVEPVTSRGS